MLSSIRHRLLILELSGRVRRQPPEEGPRREADQGMSAALTLAHADHAGAHRRVRGRCSRSSASSCSERSYVSRMPVFQVPTGRLATASATWPGQPPKMLRRRMRRFPIGHSRRTRRGASRCIACSRVRSACLCSASRCVGVASAECCWRLLGIARDRRGDPRHIPLHPSRVRALGRAFSIVAIALPLVAAMRLDRPAPWRVAVATLAVVVFQGDARHVDGHAAVRKPIVVMGHLLGGLLTFSLLSYVALKLMATRRPSPAFARAPRRRGARPHAARVPDRARAAGRARTTRRSRVDSNFPAVPGPMVAADRFP